MVTTRRKAMWKRKSQALGLWYRVRCSCGYLRVTMNYQEAINARNVHRLHDNHEAKLDVFKEKP